MHVVHQNGGWNAVHLMVFGFPSLWYCSPNGVWYSYLGISGELLARDVSVHLSLLFLSCARPVHDPVWLLDLLSVQTAKCMLVDSCNCFRSKPPELVFVWFVSPQS